MVADGFPMGSLWIPNGFLEFPMGSLWVPFVFPMVSYCFPIGARRCRRNPDDNQTAKGQWPPKHINMCKSLRQAWAPLGPDVDDQT